MLYIYILYIIYITIVFQLLLLEVNLAVLNFVHTTSSTKIIFISCLRPSAPLQVSVPTFPHSGPFYGVTVCVA